jgi:hypothetical protein
MIPVAMGDHAPGKPREPEVETSLNQVKADAGLYEKWLAASTAR